MVKMAKITLDPMQCNVTVNSSVVGRWKLENNTHTITLMCVQAQKMTVHGGQQFLESTLSGA